MALSMLYVHYKGNNLHTIKVYHHCFLVRPFWLWLSSLLHFFGLLAIFADDGRSTSTYGKSLKVLERTSGDPRSKGCCTFNMFFTRLTFLDKQDLIPNSSSTELDLLRFEALRYLMPSIVLEQFMAHSSLPNSDCSSSACIRPFLLSKAQDSFAGDYDRLLYL